MMKAKQGNVIDDFHGTKVADPYRWLEDPSSEATTKWVASMGKQADTYFSQTTTKSTDKQRLEELWDYPKHFVPQKIKNRLFYQENNGLQNQAILYMEEDAHKSVLIDPNELSKDGTVAMTNFIFSHDGKSVAYSTSVHGSDWQEIRVRDVSTKKDHMDLIQYVKFSSIAWAPDHSGFYYSRFPKPGTVSKEDEGNYNKVYFHKLGTKQEEDVLIHEQPDNKELMFRPMISDDKEYLILHVSHGTATENRVYIKSLESDGEMIYLLNEHDASYSYVTNDDHTFYFSTNLNATNSKIIAIDLHNPEPKYWKDIVLERDDVIHDILYMNGKFIVSYLHHAHHQLHVFDQTGAHSHEIELPVIGSITNMTRSKDDDDIYFGMTSYLQPTTIYKYEMDEKHLSAVKEVDLEADTSKFETNQVFYTSKDGTKVPMFITHHKDVVLDGNNPVILYGYGGFNISLTPSFNPSTLYWLEKGGIYVVANLRGGTEYGEEWHQAGMLENKQNVFDDFISAGEWLVENKYTRPEKLAIMGGSNGGLLVATCMTQRPDLFGAVLCLVPVIDMLRYHKFTIGHYWIPEFGNAENPDHFPFLYAYSPLHNIKEEQKYPPVLIATAESDDRVVPAHAKKFAATLQEKAHEESTVVLRLEAKAGHGLGKPTAKVIDEWVDFFTFLDKELNMS